MTSHLPRPVRTAAGALARGWTAVLPLLAWPIAGTTTALLLAVTLSAAVVLTGEARGRRLTRTGRPRQVFDPTATGFPDQVIAQWATVMRAAGLLTTDVPLPEWWQGVHGLADKTARAWAVATEVIDQWPPVLRGLTPVPAGYALVLRMLHGQTTTDYTRAADALAAMWRVPEVRVTAADPGHVRLTLIVRDTLAAPTPRPPVRHVVDLSAVPVGVTEDGQTWTLPLLDQAGTIVGGVPGAGKSALLSTVLAAVSGDPRVRVAAVDLKGGVDLGPWQRAGALTDLATTPAQAVELLARLATEHHTRQDLLRAHGVTKVSDLGVTHDTPLLVLLVDEAADLFTPASPDREDKALAAEAVGLVSLLVRQGRATGIATVLATQKPTTDAIPSQIRDAATSKVALRCSTPEQAKAILGDLTGHAPVSPTAIPAATPGVAVTTTTGDLVRVRVYDAMGLPPPDLPDPPLPPRAATTAGLTGSWFLPSPPSPAEPLTTGGPS